MYTHQHFQCSHSWRIHLVRNSKDLDKQSVAIPQITNVMVHEVLSMLTSVRTSDSPCQDLVRSSRGNEDGFYQ